MLAQLVLDPTRPDVICRCEMCDCLSDGCDGTICHGLDAD